MAKKQQRKPTKKQHVASQKSASSNVSSDKKARATRFAAKFARFEGMMGRIFMSILFFMFLFWIVDRVSRNFVSSRSEFESRYPEGTIRVPRPYMMFGGAANASIGREGVLNALGYRGDLPTMPKPASEYRIFVLGGSTVFHGMPAISDLVEQEFKKNGYTNVEVFNFGVVSSVSGMELSRMLFEISELSPDLVVMYNGGNDILQPFNYDPRPGYPFNYLVYESNPIMEGDVSKYPSWALWGYGSNLARSYGSGYFQNKFVNMEALRQRVGWNTENWRTQIADLYVKNAYKGSQVAKAFGADFVALLQPTIYYKDNLAPGEQQLMQRYTDRKGHAEATRELIRQRYATLKNNFLMVDLSDAYDKTNDQVFRDEIHTIQPAKPFMANAIYQVLSKTFQAKLQPGNTSSAEEAAE